jgi:hypothetical protein
MKRRADAGGVLPIARYNYAGATSAENLNRAASANTLYLTPITVGADAVAIRRIFVRQRAATAAGIKLRGAIYSNNGVSLLATGDEITTATVSVDTDIALTLPADFVPSPSTTYWIGYLADGAFTADGNSGTVALKSVAATYASGLPASPSGFSSTANGICCYISVGESTSVSATVGPVTSSTSATTAASFRAGLPANRAPGDVMFVHGTFINSSGAPTWIAPSGFSLVDQQALSDLANYRNVLYQREIDGTEPIMQLAETGSTPSVLQVSISQWRGYVLSGTPYEALATNTANNNTPKGSTITTLGANRTVINFYSNDNSNISTAPGGGNLNGWTDLYAVWTSVGFDCSSTCSYKDVASASSVTQESRSAWADTERWRSFTLALIKA